VYGRLRELVGKELYRDEIDLSPNDIRKYCISVGVAQPQPRDGAMVAPPSIYGALTMTKLHDRADLQEDGVSAYLPLGRLGSVVGETELELHELASAREPIVLTRVMTDVKLKEGRAGRMVFTYHEARFTGREGQLKALLKFVQVSR
jgi:hypothetical protein